jgi:phage tail-like protein
MTASLDTRQNVSPAPPGGARAAKSGPNPGEYPKFGMSMWFTVEVDALPAASGDLGHWAKCSGLQVEFGITTIRDGMDYTSGGVLLPERVKYSKITLERAMNDTDSRQLYTWLCQVQRNWMKPGGRLDALSARITLNDAHQGAVMDWTLVGVVPVGWKCSAFAAGQGSIAMETLELQHEGFLR